MSNPHVSLDDDLQAARIDRWLDPDPLNPTDYDRAYAQGFADAWEATERDDDQRWRVAGLLLCALSGAVVGFFFAIAVVTAAPRSAQTTERVDLSAPSSAGLIGAPRSGMAVEAAAEATRVAPTPVGEVGAPHRPPALSSPAADSRIESGLASYVAERFGPRYLALPGGPGIRVRICSRSGTVCLERTSTDAGPDLAMQRAGRIADLSLADFATVCGCTPRLVGVTPVTVEYLGEPGLTPPPTSTRP